MRIRLTKKICWIMFTILLLSLPFQGIAERKVPTYIEWLRQSYAEISARDNYTFSVGSQVNSTFHERNVISANCIIEAYTSYEFDISLPNTSEYAVRIYLFMNSNDPENRSFKIYCNNDYVAPKIIKELILATMDILGNNLDDGSAEQALRGMVVSFDGINHSNVYSCGDYLVFLSSGGKDSNQTVINVVDKQTLVMDEECRSEYIQMTYAEMCAPLNVGESVEFTGIPTKNISDASSSETDVDFFVVELPDGVIMIRINFDTTPISLELNMPYRFWGCLMGGEHSGTGAVRVDYAETID